jgi:hypothetical protein
MGPVSSIGSPCADSIMARSAKGAQRRGRRCVCSPPFSPSPLRPAVHSSQEPDELNPASHLTGGVQIPLVGPPRPLPCHFFKPDPAAPRDVGPSLPNATKELGMMFKPVVEPGLLGSEPNKDASRAAMPRDYHLLGLSQPQVARQVILHLRQSHPAGLGCPAGQSTLGPGLTRRSRGPGLLFR